MEGMVKSLRRASHFGLLFGAPGESPAPSVGHFLPETVGAASSGLATSGRESHLNPHENRRYPPVHCPPAQLKKRGDASAGKIGFSFPVGGAAVRRSDD